MHHKSKSRHRLSIFEPQMSTLFLIPTPIGNLEDITLRAIRILKESDLILCEDTRTSGRLLKHFEIDTKMRPYHQHNEHKVTDEILDLIKAGEKISLITDAGTPGISDPGFLIVRAALEQNIKVECLPGPVALIPALVQSGLPCDRFIFEGFLPVKKGKQTKLKELAEESRTIVIYESPHRIAKTLEQMIPFFGEERQAVVCRELSKLYEENVRGTLSKVLTHFKEKKVKGEIILIVAGKEKA